MEVLLPTLIPPLHLDEGNFFADLRALDAVTDIALVFPAAMSIVPKSFFGGK